MLQHQREIPDWRNVIKFMHFHQLISCQLGSFLCFFFCLSVHQKLFWSTSARKKQLKISICSEGADIFLSILLTYSNTCGFLIYRQNQQHATGRNQEKVEARASKLRIQLMAKRRSMRCWLQLNRPAKVIDILQHSSHLSDHEHPKANPSLSSKTAGLVARICY